MPLLALLLALLSVPTLLSACPLPQSEIPQPEDVYRQERLEMVEQHLRSRDIHHEGVLEAMSRVPRHLFMPSEVRQYAYADQAAPIGSEQTLSQPYVVALMTQSVDPKPQDLVLEIGTGSGYQAAVLAELTREVFTIEIVPELAESAARTLEEQGYSNVRVRQGDGYQGWPSEAPFDVVMITAAAERIPEPLIEQLAEGGRLIMPLGQVDGIQTLTLVTRKDGQTAVTGIIPVRFVPMTGEIQDGR